MSRALKLAKKELTRLGCEIVAENRYRIKFQLARREWICFSGTALPAVRAVVETERRIRATMSGSYFDRYPVAHTWEPLGEGDFYVTKHCKERITDMRGQGLTVSQIVAAVLAPESVRDLNGRLLYCAGVIGVLVGARVNGKHPLITVLWGTDELWEQNPRPEKGEPDG